MNDSHTIHAAHSCIPALGAGFLLGLAAVMLHTTELAHEPEEALRDRILQATTAPANTPLVLVPVSDLAGVPWPFPRLDHALVLRALARYEPRAIGLRVPLEGADTFHETHDAQLARTLKQTRPVLLGGSAMMGAGFDLPPASMPSIPFVGDLDGLPDYSGGIWPQADLSEAAMVAPQNHFPDRSGIVRRAPLVVRFGTMLSPSWAVALFGSHMGADWLKSEARIGEALELRNHRGQTVALIPMDKRGTVRLPFPAAVPEREEVEFWSVLLADQQLRSGEKPVYNLRNIKGRTVLIGSREPTITDRISTPAGFLYPIELEALAFDTLFSGRWIQEAGFTESVLVLLGLCTLMAVLGAQRNILWRIAGLAALPGFACAGVWLLYSYRTAYPMLTIFSAATVSFIVGAALSGWIPASSTSLKPSGSNGKDTSGQDLGSGQNGGAKNHPAP